MSPIVITREAIDIITRDQCEALVRLSESDKLEKLVVTTGSTLDLPDGYLSFRQDWKTGQPIYGGIAPNGDVST
jgi:hypothetical protein